VPVEPVEPAAPAAPEDGPSPAPTKRHHNFRQGFNHPQGPRDGSNFRGGRGDPDAPPLVPPSFDSGVPPGSVKAENWGYDNGYDSGYGGGGFGNGRLRDYFTDDYGGWAASRRALSSFALDPRAPQEPRDPQAPQDPRGSPQDGPRGLWGGGYDSGYDSGYGGGGGFGNGRLYDYFNGNDDGWAGAESRRALSTADGPRELWGGYDNGYDSGYDSGGRLYDFFNRNSNDDGWASADATRALSSQPAAAAQDGRALWGGNSYDSGYGGGRFDSGSQFGFRNGGDLRRRARRTVRRFNNNRGWW
jgi:hypothetical protein